MVFGPKGLSGATALGVELAVWRSALPSCSSGALRSAHSLGSDWRAHCVLGRRCNRLFARQHGTDLGE
jgi:hypothetical protein